MPAPPSGSLGPSRHAKPAPAGGAGTQQAQKTGVSTLQRGAGSHSRQQVCLSRHVSAVGHVRYATIPASPGGNVKTQRVCK